jgi:hypothetical protein
LLKDPAQLDTGLSDAVEPTIAALLGLNLPFEQMKNEPDQIAADFALIALPHVFDFLGNV